MTELKIDAATARKEYPQASPAMKAIFEQSFGKAMFSTNIIDRVTTMDDVFAELGKDKEQFYKDCHGLPMDEVGYREAKLIALALNEGKEINGLDENQAKWFPWHRIDGPSGFRFHCSCYDRSFSFVGSRLCMVEKRLSDHAGVAFIDVYKKLKTA